MKSRIIILLSLVLMVGGLGCAALSKYATPTEIDEKAVKYTVDAGVAEPNDYAGYPNLLKAERLVKDVDAAHILNRQELEQAMQREDTTHNILHGKADANYQMGVRREEMLFGETGILSLGLSMLGAGGFAGFLGLMRKRPGDITSEEYESAIASASGKARDELSTKQRQFAQLVSGIGKFMDEELSDSDTIRGRFKEILNQTQDTDTQIAVAAVKKS